MTFAAARQVVHRPIRVRTVAAVRRKASRSRKDTPLNKSALTFAMAGSVRANRACPSSVNRTGLRLRFASSRLGSTKLRSIKLARARLTFIGATPMISDSSCPANSPSPPNASTIRRSVEVMSIGLATPSRIGAAMNVASFNKSIKRATSPSIVMSASVGVDFGGVGAGMVIAPIITGLAAVGKSLSFRVRNVGFLHHVGP